MNYSELYYSLFDEDDEDKQQQVDDRLIDLVVYACDLLAERVNSTGGPVEQINWLFDQGFTEEEIKEFVGRKQ